jgi:hypothetical protein
MPDSPRSGHPSATGPQPGPSPAPGPTEIRSAPASPTPFWPQPQGRPYRPSRLPIFTAVASLVVALVAVGVAMAAWLRPMPQENPPPSEAVYSDEQVAAAKADVCEAYKAVDQAVVTNTHRPNPVEGDEIGSLAAAANARLSLYAGGDYLLSRLAERPATPHDLAVPARSLANLYKQFSIRALDNVSNSNLDTLRSPIDETSATIERLCQ